MRSPGIALVYRQRKESSADDADGAGHHERQRRGDLPEYAAGHSGRRYGETADEVVQPDPSGANLRLNEIDDQRLADRVPHFPETADHEGDNETPEAVSGHDGKWEQRKRHERGDHERLSADAVSQARHREIAHDGRCHLDRDEDAKLRRTDSHDVEGVQDEKNVDHALAGADE